jgi:hypothetical protein
MKILTLLFMFSSNCLYSQVVLYKGFVFSKSTSLAIENATVKIIKNDNTIFSILSQILLENLVLKIVTQTKLILLKFHI